MSYNPFFKVIGKPEVLTLPCKTQQKANVICCPGCHHQSFPEVCQEQNTSWSREKTSAACFPFT